LEALGVLGLTGSKSLGISMAFGMIPTRISQRMTKTGQKAIDLVVQHGATWCVCCQNWLKNLKKTLTNWSKNHGFPQTPP
jgi:hypothetical protein